MFWGYTKFLERQNEILNEKIEKLEARNQELLLAIISKTPASALANISGETPEPKHKMSKGDTQAKCSCGWVYVSDDPGKLQTAITTHYRDVRVSGGRKTWSQTRSRLEGAAEENQ